MKKQLEGQICEETRGKGMKMKSDVQQKVKQTYMCTHLLAV